MNKQSENNLKEGNVSLQSLHMTKMKDRTWLIVSVVMGLALIISVGYSLKLRKRIIENQDVIVSMSIVQITASNVSIKNVLTVKGKVEVINENNGNNKNDIESMENAYEESLNDLNVNENKSYYIGINLSEEAAKKVKLEQKVEIKIKNDDKVYKYKGNISKIEQNENNNKKAIVKFENDENIKENQEAECTIIIQEAKDVIALPIAAIKTRKLDNNNTETNTNNKNQSNITNDTNLADAFNNKPKEEKYVIVVNDDGTTSEIVVETGISDEYYVEIVSGLSEGQKVQIEEE